MNLRAYSNKTGKPLARFTKRKERISKYIKLEIKETLLYIL